MAERDTANFLRLMNERNNRIAASKTEEVVKHEEEIDKTRVERMDEYREKWDHNLRARPHTRSRVTRARSKWDTVGTQDN